MEAANPLHHLLADTWWYGLSQRMSWGRFQMLAERRADQGFSAIQLVVGIPPEVGPKHPSACSEVGFPWSLDGTINDDYLKLARSRIRYLNDLGLRAVVYGAWGHQIEWTGPQFMSRWWNRIIESVDDLNVIYCITGESNLWIGSESRLLPDRSTGEQIPGTLPQRLPFNDSFLHLLTRIRTGLRRNLIAQKLVYRSRTLTRSNTAFASKRDARKKAWSTVLEYVVGQTRHPILIHTLPGERSLDVVYNGHFLSAMTVQTGHSLATRNDLWQIPMSHPGSGQPYMNLEPWYEGILDRFGPSDQLFAYWVSMMAGALGFCYGAHGVWNVGDGNFLSHWGKQTFEQAGTLDTPRLLGASHRLFKQHLHWSGAHGFETNGTELIRIGKQNKNNWVHFYPEASKAKTIPSGRCWLPMVGEYTDHIPGEGPLVVFN